VKNDWKDEVSRSCRASGQRRKNPDQLSELRFITSIEGGRTGAIKKGGKRRGNEEGLQAKPLSSSGKTKTLKARAKKGREENH